MRSAAQRIAAYNARMQSSQIDPVLTAVNDQQKANFAAYVGDFYPYQLLLRDWLNDEGIHGVLAFQFEAFNGECYSAHRRFSGPSLAAQITVLADKYEDMGVTRADLVEIALSVWGVTIT
jgi:hypothetical protein